MVEPPPQPPRTLSDPDRARAGFELRLLVAPNIDTERIDAGGVIGVGRARVHLQAAGPATSWDMREPRSTVMGAADACSPEWSRRVPRSVNIDNVSHRNYLGKALC